ncbi:apolipoprotein A1/A4/E family protein [Longimicrobium terrae]|uniref:DNA-binding protein H-NS n=1 Tax=Longimicrobium terrae TaxID=1639882 RepID=A0A841GN83_9BACT|nr:apolipoprotein A1/A4/E family protein [Longimicrobium terrae]MBB4635875.1 DNA-binding protein H-NS [Longimicrobium terrae]MBB6070271.1 DNA-binding protein H-NS [Longimicrobium terrae]
MRQIQSRQQAVAETWEKTVERLREKVEAEVERLRRSGAEAAEQIRESMEAAGQGAAGITTELRTHTGEMQKAVDDHTTALREAVAEQGKLLAGSTREAASSIGVARHELALSVAELKRRAFRHAVLLGASTAIVILLSARLFFPFWGMTRGDVEDLSRGARLIDTWERKPPAERQALLRALGWESMPGAAPAPRSTSNAHPAAGR